MYNLDIRVYSNQMLCNVYGWCKCFIFCSVDTILIRGNQTGVESASTQLEALCQNILQDDFKIQLVAVKDVYQNSCKSGKIGQIEKETR